MRPPTTIPLLPNALQLHLQVWPPVAPSAHQSPSVRRPTPLHPCPLHETAWKPNKPPQLWPTGHSSDKTTRTQWCLLHELCDSQSLALQLLNGFPSEHTEDHWTQMTIASNKMTGMLGMWMPPTIEYGGGGFSRQVKFAAVNFAVGNFAEHPTRVYHPPPESTVCTAGTRNSQRTLNFAWEISRSISYAKLKCHENPPPPCTTEAPRLSQLVLTAKVTRGEGAGGGGVRWRETRTKPQIATAPFHGAAAVSDVAPPRSHGHGGGDMATVVACSLARGCPEQKGKGVLEDERM